MNVLISMKDSSSLRRFADPRLFYLPRELRDEIWAACCEEGVYGFVEHGLKFNFTLGLPDDRRSQPLPVWLLACKRMMDEGMMQFYKHSTCSIWLKPRDSTNTNNPRQLLSIHHARRFDLTISLAFTESDPSTGKQAGQLALIPNPESQNTSFVDDVARHLELGKSSLRSIKIRVVTPLFSYVWPPIKQGSLEEELAADLSLLEKFGTGWKSVEFIIAEPEIDSLGANALQLAEVSYLLIQRELVRIAKCLVYSEDGTEGSRILEDWLERQCFEGDQTRQTGYDWHLKARHTGGITQESVVFWGMASCHDINGKYSHFYDRNGTRGVAQ